MTGRPFTQQDVDHSYTLWALLEVARGAADQLHDQLIDQLNVPYRYVNLLAAVPKALEASIAQWEKVHDAIELAERREASAGGTTVPAFAADDPMLDLLIEYRRQVEVYNETVEREPGKAGSSLYDETYNGVSDRIVEGIETGALKITTPAGGLAAMDALVENASGSVKRLAVRCSGARPDHRRPQLHRLDGGRIMTTRRNFLKGIAAAPVAAVPALAEAKPRGVSLDFIDSLPRDAQALVFLAIGKSLPVEQRRGLIADMRGGGVNPELCDAYERAIMRDET